MRLTQSGREKTPESEPFQLQELPRIGADPFPGHPPVHRLHFFLRQPVDLAVFSEIVIAVKSEKDARYPLPGEAVHNREGFLIPFVAVVHMEIGSEARAGQYVQAVHPQIVQPVRHCKDKADHGV